MRRVIFGMPTVRSAPTVQYGIAQGYFRDEGIDLSVRALHGGPAIAAALDRGDLELAQIGTPPALVAHSQGARFRIVASGIKQKLHLYLGVRRDVDSMQALRGGRIGLLSRGSCDEWVVRRILLLHGLQADVDVELVPVLERYEDIVELIAERSIDGALAIDPNMSAGEEQGVLRIEAAAYDDPYLPLFQWTVLAASDRLISREPALVQALLRAYARSSRAARDDSEAFIAFTAEAFRFSPAVIRRSMLREMPHYACDCRINAAGLEKAIELQMSLQALQTRVVAEDFVDLRFLPDLSDGPEGDGP